MAFFLPYRLHCVPVCGIIQETLRRGGVPVHKNVLSILHSLQFCQIPGLSGQRGHNGVWGNGIWPAHPFTHCSYVSVVAKKEISMLKNSKINGNLLSVLSAGVIVAVIAGIVGTIKVIFSSDVLE